MTGGSQGGVSAAWWEVYTPTKVALSLDYTHKPWYSNKFSCYEFRGRRSAFETLIDIRDALEDPERLHPGLRHIIETQRNRS